jgi:hypothetical protein
MPAARRTALARPRSIRPHLTDHLVAVPGHLPPQRPRGERAAHAGHAPLRAVVRPASCGVILARRVATNWRTSSRLSTTATLRPVPPTLGAVRFPTPLPGAHTIEILASLGYAARHRSTASGGRRIARTGDGGTDTGTTTTTVATRSSTHAG